MKTEVQEKIIIKPLLECLEELSKEKLEELYEEVLDLTGEPKSKKISKEDKKECIYGHEFAKYLTFIMFLNKENTKDLEEIIIGNKLNDLCDYLLEENYIFKINNIYYIPEEFKKSFEESKTSGMNKGKINILITYYMVSNGLLEVNKLIELIKESGYDVTKKELEEISKSNNYKIKKGIVYLNEVTEDLNKDDKLLKMKNISEYKIANLDEAIARLMLIDSESNLGYVKDFFKKKVKNKEELDSLVRLIFNILLLNCEIERMVEGVLIENNIKLNETENEDFYEELECIAHDLPSWTLNGYTPHEIFYEGDEDDEDYDFDDLTDEEKKEIYILNYTLINGIISIDKLIEILANEHNLKTNKKEVIKIVKESDIESETCIIEDYVCYTKFTKEDFNWILSMKKLDTYKVIDNVDDLIDELEENDFELELICEDYNLNDDILNQLKSIMQIGILDEDVLMTLFEQMKKPMPLKKQHTLYKELKDIIKKTRMWILNGYTPLELNSRVKKEKIGRNEPCICGSGKKYKQCCGK